MNLIQLQYFTITAKMEHISKAAEALHISQPALSKAIAVLESELGVKLFDRDGKRIKLNAYGDAVMKASGRIHDEIDNLLLQLNDMKNSMNGYVNVASTFPSREPSGLMNCIRNFMSENPGVRLILHQQSVTGIIESLNNRVVDVAVSSVPIIASGIIWDVLFSERMGVMIADGHPLAERDTVFMEDLKDEFFLGNGANTDVHDMMYAFARQAGFEPKVYFEGDYPGFIHEAVAKGVGVSLISQDGFRWSSLHSPYFPVKDKLVFKLLSNPYCKRLCGTAVLNDRYHPKVVTGFCRYLKENIEKYNSLIEE
jgi:DNA-binding transcriptional LysR family regulator